MAVGMCHTKIVIVIDAHVWKCATQDHNLEIFSAMNSLKRRLLIYILVYCILLKPHFSCVSRAFFFYIYRIYHFPLFLSSSYFSLNNCHQILYTFMDPYFLFFSFLPARWKFILFKNFIC